VLTLGFKICLKYKASEEEKKSQWRHLFQDMPIAINKVENASTLLEEASNLSKADPYSKMARYR
jgi:hypothetical protein